MWVVDFFFFDFFFFFGGGGGCRGIFHVRMPRDHMELGGAGGGSAEGRDCEPPTIRLGRGGRRLLPDTRFESSVSKW